MKTDYASYLRDRGPVRLLLRRLFLLPVKRYFRGKVLDIGAGIGEFLDCYPDSIGIDRDYAAVAYCHARGVRCIQADAYLLPFRSDSFDGVLLNNVLEHLECPADALSEIMRVLKKGGRLMIEIPGKKGFHHDETHVRFWVRNDIADLLKLHGFLDIKTHYFPIPCEKAGDIFAHNKLRVCAVLVTIEQ